jgi:hypothetical protein
VALADPDDRIDLLQLTAEHVDIAARPGDWEIVR